MSEDAIRQAMLAELAGHLEDLQQRREFNALSAYRPTEKQMAFHAASATHRQRLLMAANQSGKTYGAGCEVAYHMTGLYPDWWEGKRYPGPTVGWASGVTAESTRDNPQRILLGRKRNWGTGTIPKEYLIGDPTLARTVPDAVDSFAVRHVPTGGVSLCNFKYYMQGREKWQGETLDWVWPDEEPPMDIYVEGLTRLNRRKGIMFITFTPMMGMTEVVSMFLHPEPGDRGKRLRTVINMTLDDATFYTAEEKEDIEAQYSPEMRKARVLGLPLFGEGLVYPVQDEMIRIDPIAIPAHWRRICGIDFGLNHPTAVVWLAHDPDTDVVYVYDCYRVADALISTHATAIKARGDRIPVAWPHDGLKRDPKSGMSLADLYRMAPNKIDMLPDSARYNPEKGGPQGSGPILLATLERMRTGRFKVFSTCHDWFEEKNMYHRKDGIPVPYKDDIMSATNYGMMDLRHARPTETMFLMPQAKDYDPLNFHLAPTPEPFTRITPWGS